MEYRLNTILSGEASSPPILLIMGFGMQMIGWDEEFCMQLADKGYYVIRFDNRDVGLSTKIEEGGVPDMMTAMTAAAQGQKIDTPYTLKDMAEDAIGLLDALGIEKAHICGASMGSAITQNIGIYCPTRVLSLISIMGSTGNPELPQAKPEAIQALTTPAPTDREEYIELSISSNRVLRGPGYPFNEERIRERAALAYDRSFYPEGRMRQMVAIMADGNRKPALQSVTAPTLVIHGADDPLVPVEGGKDTAEAIPGAELLIIEGMGHELPPEVWSKTIDAIDAHIRNLSF